MPRTVLFKIFPVLLALLSSTVRPALANEDLRLRVLGQWVSTSAELLGPESLDDAVGGYVGVETMWSPRWGLELGIGHAELETRQAVTFDGLFFSVTSEFATSLRWTPVTAAANYHLTPNRQADLYIAPRIGWAFADDLEVEADVLAIEDSPYSPYPIFDIPRPNVPPATSTLSVDDSFIYGARLGLDWPIGSDGWDLSGAIDYTVMTPDIEGHDVDINPLTVGFGFARRW